MAEKRLIDANALYERTCSLEAQALNYVGKLIERDGDEVTTKWKIWSAILTERTAFKHDLFDAPTIEERKKGKWIEVHGYCTPGGDPVWACSECGKGEHVYGIEYPTYSHNVSDGQWVSCPNCGADMRERT